MKNLTIIILTFNEENNIIPCLESFKGVSANVFVVDSFSTDKTIDLLKENQITFVQHPFENYSAQRNWALANNPFQTEWVFQLDAGERFTPELVNWINSKFNPKDTTVDGYMFSRRTMIFGKEVRHGGQYPNFHLRLFKANKGKCENKLYDQHFVVEGNKKVIKNRVDIIDTVLDSWMNFVQAHNKWAMFEAIEIIKKEKETGDVRPKFFGSPIERRRWLKNNIFQKAPLFLRAFMFFFYRYFIKLGFLDGKTGLAFHFIQGCWFRFLIDANVMEIRHKMKTGNKSFETLILDEYGERFAVLVKRKTS